MNWREAIDRNGEALRRILAMLVAMADCRLPNPDCRLLPRHLHRAVLRLLRPAESAARRLVIIAARGLAVTLPSIRKRGPLELPNRPGYTLNSRGNPVPMPRRRPESRPRRPVMRVALPLFDRLPRFAPNRLPAVPPSHAPRIFSFGAPLTPLAARTHSRLPGPPMPDDLIPATRLSLRLQALSRALDDLPREALRFARWKARRDRDRASPTRAPRRVWPLKPGRPPGLPKGRYLDPDYRPKHEVHAVLADLQHFANRALEPDTP